MSDNNKRSTTRRIGASSTTATATTSASATASTTGSTATRGGAGGCSSIGGVNNDVPPLTIGTMLPIFVAIQETVLIVLRFLQRWLTKACVALKVYAAEIISQIGQSPLDIDVDTGKTIVTGEETDHLVPGAESVPGSPLFYIMIGIGMAAFSVSTTSFFIIANQLSDLSSLTVMVLSPLLLFQTLKLQGLTPMRQQQNNLRVSANRLSEENQILKETSVELQQNVDGLKSVETQLDDLSRRQQRSIEDLVDIVNAMQETTDELKKFICSDIIECIMSSIFASGRNHDFSLSEQETQLLILRLTNMTNGVTVNVERLQALINRRGKQGQMEVINIADIARQLERDSKRSTAIHLGNNNNTNGNKTNSTSNMNGKQQQDLPVFEFEIFKAVERLKNGKNGAMALLSPKKK